MWRVWQSCGEGVVRASAVSETGVRHWGTPFLATDAGKMTRADARAEFNFTAPVPRLTG